jgi:hypothetical protein
MKNISKVLSCLGLTMVSFAVAPSTACAAVAGHVQFVSGNVQISNQVGQVRPARKGDAINESDVLISALQSTAQIKMQDGGFIAVRPDTRLKFDHFVFAGKEDGSEKSFFSLFKGGFRAVTGLIGRVNKQSYRITTPAATIGIRGTDHETFVITPDSPLAQMAPSGAYNKVNVGETYMATEKGTIFVQPNQMGYAGGMNQMPQIQPVNANVFTVVATPDKETPVEKKEGNGKDGAGQDRPTENADKGDEADGAENANTEPVRENAVVDAVAPVVGGIAADTPMVLVGAADAAQFLPVAPLPVVIDAGGTVINFTNPTIPAAVSPLNGLPVQGSILGVLIQNTSPNGSQETWMASSRLLPVNFDANGIQTIMNWCGGCGVNSTDVARIAVTGVAASSFDAGADVGVVSWGRWSNGDTTFGGWGPVVLGPDQAFHFVVGQQTSVLPTTSAMVRFNLLGATAPTNNLVAGLATGPVTASGFLDVNFAAQTTATQMNIASGNAAFQIVGTGTGFSGADFSMSGTTLLTGGTAPFCATACPTNIVGSFFGVGATHAGLAYRANASASGGGVIDGAAVFK